MSATHDILIEVGAEEIPHRFLPDATAELHARFVALLVDAGLSFRDVETTSTPRRLTVILRGVAARQGDRVEELVGPPVEQAFKDGVATKAAEGFAKKCGVPVEALKRVATDKGERVAAVREIAGRTAQEVLSERGAEPFAALPWPKNMRWGGGDRTWVRPVHWIVALCGTETLDIELFRIRSDRHTRGHRTLHAAPVPVPSVHEYFDVLRRVFVVAKRSERLELIRQGLAKAAATHEAKLLADPGLLEACADLVEWPIVVSGAFPEQYLELPDVVLSTAMRVHQKFFALEAGGKLLPRFLHVAGNDDPEGTIARNNASVLVARLEDARFYWTSDLARPLASRVDELSRVLFQEKLGSYLDKTRRMEALALRVASLLDPTDWTEDREIQQLVQAVELCKADQTTHVVKEFTELQGIMGGIYLRREGYPENTWRAVEEHHLPQSLTDPVPATRFGALLAIVDKLDTRVGCLGGGVIPTGSKDPFGLRRAAQGLVRTMLESGIDLSVRELASLSCDLYSNVGGFEQDRVTAELLPYLENRARFLLSEGLRLAPGGRPFPQDEVAACLGASWDRLPGLLARLRALHAVRSAERQADFEALSIAFKRVRNIVKAQPAAALDKDKLVEPAERELAAAVRKVAALPLPASGDEAGWRVRIEALAGLRPAVDRFFDDVMVMAEDESLRRNRIALLQEIERLFLEVADIGELAPSQR